MTQSKNKKIKYTAFMVSSIDGLIARDSGSGIDWTSKEDSDFYHDKIKNMDVVVVGSNTYKVASGRSWKNAVVLTTKVKLPKKEGKIVFLNPDKTDLKKFLQIKKYKKVAIIGGGKVYNFCLKNKMIDELYLTIEPYVFTKGISMFSGNEFNKYRFELKSVKKLNRNTLLLHYNNLSVS